MDSSKTDSNLTSHKDAPKEEALSLTTKGTKIFDMAAYGGVSWLANAAASVVIAYKFSPRSFQLNPKTSWNPAFEKGVDWAKKHMFDPLHATLPIINNERKSVHGACELLTLMSGGYIMTVPVKIMEDNKRAIVTKLDALLYDDTPENQAFLDKAHQKLDNEPRQTWASVMGSRTVALGGVYGAFFSPIGPAIDKYIFTPTTAGIIKSAGANANGAFAKVTDLAVKDVTWSLYCAGLFYGITRVWHNFFHQEPPVQNPLAPSTESTKDAKEPPANNNHPAAKNDNHPKLEVEHSRSDGRISALQGLEAAI